MPNNLMLNLIMAVVEEELKGAGTSEDKSKRVRDRLSGKVKKRIVVKMREDIGRGESS